MPRILICVEQAPHLGERLFSAALVLPSILFAPDRVRALLFFALVAFIMAPVLVNRSFSTSLTRAVWRNNPSLRYVAAVVSIACALILTVEPLRRILHFASLEPADLCFRVLVLLLCERVKDRKRFLAAASTTTRRKEA